GRPFIGTRHRERGSGRLTRRLPSSLWSLRSRRSSVQTTRARSVRWRSLRERGSGRPMRRLPSSLWSLRSRRSSVQTTRARSDGSGDVGGLVAGAGGVTGPVGEIGGGRLAAPVDTGDLLLHLAAHRLDLVADLLPGRFGQLTGLGTQDARGL